MRIASERFSTCAARTRRMAGIWMSCDHARSWRGALRCRHLSTGTVAPEKIEKIFAVLRDAPKANFVHCRSGADRAGFVSALYRYAIEGQSAEVAARELSLRYGHFPYLTSKSGAMDESARAYFSSHAPPPRVDP